MASKDREGAGGVPAWRFVLVQLDGKEVKRGFASLKELYAHLGRTLGGAP